MVQSKANLWKNRVCHATAIVILLHFEVYRAALLCVPHGPMKSSGTPCCARDTYTSLPTDPGLGDGRMILSGVSSTHEAETIDPPVAAIAVDTPRPARRYVRNQWRTGAQPE